MCLYLALNTVRYKNGSQGSLSITFIHHSTCPTSVALKEVVIVVLRQGKKVPLPSSILHHNPRSSTYFTNGMALDNFFQNKIEDAKLEIVAGQAVLRRLEAQRNDYNSRVRLLREELGLLQQPGSYVGEVVKVMGTKKVLVKVHPEGKYGKLDCSLMRAPPR